MYDDQLQHHLEVTTEVGRLHMQQSASLHAVLRTVLPFLTR
jgi:hypothetical protein